jgi:Flp pilus assembly protein TadD
MAGLAQFLVGHELNGRYRLETVLGEGGFGVVFRAADLERGRDVAVKVLDPPRGMTPVQVERLRQRFVHEAELAARLPLHPNLVRVLDFGRTERLDFLVMELLRGESLRERLARPEPVSLRSALHLLRDAARGVAVGHENGMVHRDLKPANIFLEGDGQGDPHVRILDFGIAKMLDEDDDEETRTHLTLPGEWFGSEFYSPPEHLRRDPVTRSSDVYSLGVVGFELLTRTRLFSKDDMVRRKQGLPVPIPSLVARNAAVPREVEAIVRRALEDDPEARFDDAGALAAELHRAISRLRRSGDLPADAAGDAAVPAGGRATDGDATELVEGDGTEAVPAPGRRMRDLALTGLEADLRRVRLRKLRRRLVQAATIAAMGLGAVAGGYGLVQMRAAGGETVRTPPRELNAAEENQEGLLRFRRDDYQGALESFARAVQKAPGNAEYANNHAYALLRAGRAHEAVSALSDVVARYPQRQVAYSNLAEAQLVAGDTAGAIASMQSLLALYPNPTRRREAESLLERLGAPAWDLAEWEDTQDAVEDSAPLETEDPNLIAPYGAESGGYQVIVPTEDTIITTTTATTDTMSAWDGDGRSGRNGVIRRRRP